MLVPMRARLILTFALFLVSSVLSEQTIISSSDINANNEFLCPSFAGVTVANATHLSSTNFSETYIQSETNLRTCNFSKCLESSHRLSCNLAYTNAGLKDINVDKHFPFLSYNRKAAVSTRPKSLSSHSSKKLSIAYVFLVHEQFNQTTRLIKAVYDPNNVYILHVDSKAADLKEELINFANDFHNVYVLEKSFDIRWGGIEMVYSTLEGIFAALDIDAKWDFVINLSSKDYPLCSDADLSAYLATRKGKNFDIADLPDPMGEKFWRARAMYVWCEQSQCYQFRERQLPFNVDSYVGSQWFVYSREFAQYLRTDSFPRLMLAHYEHTWIPDEGYFGTVLLNSPFKDTRIKNNLRYIVFDQIHPYYWTDDDFPLLESKTDSCFTRKFEWNATVFNLIDTLIGSGPRKLSLP